MKREGCEDEMTRADEEGRTTTGMEEEREEASPTYTTRTTKRR